MVFSYFYNMSYLFRMLFLTFRSCSCQDYFMFRIVRICLNIMCLIVYRILVKLCFVFLIKLCFRIKLFFVLY